MKKRSSKEIFMEAFLELTKTIPADRITVRQIVEESGLSSKTFYNHFSDKYALMSFVEERKIEHLRARLNQGSYHFEELLAGAVRFTEANRHYFKNVMLNTSGQESFEKKHIKHTCEAFRVFLLRSNNITEVSPEIGFALKMYAAGFSEMLRSEYIFSEGKDADEFVSECLENMPEKLKPYLA